MTQRTADRLIQATTVTGTTTVTLGAAWTGGFQTLAQAVAAGAGNPDALAIGRKGVEFCVLDPNTGAWETASYTITDSTTLTRDYVLSSSNNGLPVAFAAGTKQVICVSSSSRLAAGLVDPDDVGFDIVLCAGQSNMEGNPPSDPLIDINDPRVYQWSTPLGDATRHQILSSTEPLYMVTGVRTGKTGPATHFARAYLATVPGNRKVLLVPVAAGSTGLVNDYWQPGSPGGTGYETAIAETNLAIVAAIAMFPNSRFVGTILAQGEADGMPDDGGHPDRPVPQWRYAMNLKALIAGFRSRITGAANSWFVISAMTPEGMVSYPGEVAIDAAHKQVAAEVDRVAFVPGLPTGNAAGQHWTSPAIRIMGARMGCAVPAAKRSVGKDTTVPVIVAAAVANAAPSTVNLTFSEVLDATAPPAASAFAVTGHTITSVAISGNTATVGLGQPFANGETRNIGYTAPGSNPIKDLAGNPLASGASFAITNNVAASGADTTRPTVSGTPTISSASPTVIAIPFSEALAAGTPPNGAFTVGGTANTIASVAISGSTVNITMNTAYVAGNSATVTYAPTGTNDLQDAASNKVLGFGPLAVTNNAAAGGGGSFTTMSTTDKDSSITLSNGNLTATGTVAGFKSARGASGKSTGKWYYEATVVSVGGSRVMIGFGAAGAPLNDFAGNDAGGLAAGYDSTTGNLYAFGGSRQPQATYAAGDVIGVALDLTNNTVQFFKNGAPQTQATLWAQITGAKPLFPMVTTNSAGASLTMNFGASAFTSLPAGFSGWTP